MSTRPAELAVDVLAAVDVAAAVTAGSDLVYLRDDASGELESILDALAGRSLRLGLSLDYSQGLDPRLTGVAPADIDLSDALLARLTAFAETARERGLTLETVGCHGNLALDVAEDERCTQVIARALLRFDAGLSLAIAAGSRGVAVAHHCGIAVLREARADQAIDHVQRCGGENVLPRVDRHRMERLDAGDRAPAEPGVGARRCGGRQPAATFVTQSSLAADGAENGISIPSSPKKILPL